MHVADETSRLLFNCPTLSRHTMEPDRVLFGITCISSRTLRRSLRFFYMSHLSLQLPPRAHTRRCCLCLPLKAAFHTLPKMLAYSLVSLEAPVLPGASSFQPQRRRTTVRAVLRLTRHSKCLFYVDFVVRRPESISVNLRGNICSFLYVSHQSFPVYLLLSLFSLLLLL